MKKITKAESTSEAKYHKETQTTTHKQQVICSKCGWTGTTYQLICVYISDPVNPTEVVGVDGCPACHTHNHLLFESDMKKAYIIGTDPAVEAYMAEAMEVDRKLDAWAARQDYMKEVECD